MLKLVPFTITNIVLTISSIVVYIWDVGSDVKLATHHYFNKHYWYCGLTLLFVVLPSLVMAAYMSRLSLIDCFMESAPQLVLQLYIVAKGDPQSTNIWTVVSVLGSLVALSMALVNFSLQGDVINKQEFMVKFTWVFFTIAARVLAFSLFASIFPFHLGVFICAYWLMMFAWIVYYLLKRGCCNYVAPETNTIDHELNIVVRKNILFVTTDDRVYGLGSNSEGVLGLGHNRPIDTPEEIE
ncbi:unnamed protein product [Medioppia subpectinata]|uniref:XK-related protein n=1 Tax=Medioppia subpectinata TaxID=1979941 RepID=A0A7R9KV52_9ACAR|nr:unnamed protein product [Medioppia subpectinata]CAG2110455.1 unnamed protein product [Medioppia subpectinata]